MYISSYWKKLDSKIAGDAEARRGAAPGRAASAGRRTARSAASGVADAQPERARELAADQDPGGAVAGRTSSARESSSSEPCDEVVAQVGHLRDARRVDAAHAHARRSRRASPRTMPSASTYGDAPITPSARRRPSSSTACVVARTDRRRSCTVKCARLPMISSRQVRSKPFITESTVMISHTPAATPDHADAGDHRDEGLAALREQVAHRDEPLGASAARSRMPGRRERHEAEQHRREHERRRARRRAAATSSLGSGSASGERRAERERGREHARTSARLARRAARAAGAGAARGRDRRRGDDRRRRGVAELRGAAEHERVAERRAARARRARAARRDEAQHEREHEPARARARERRAHAREPERAQPLPRGRAPASSSALQYSETAPSSARPDAARDAAITRSAAPRARSARARPPPSRRRAASSR